MGSEFLNPQFVLLEPYTIIQHYNLLPCDVVLFQNRLLCVKLTKITSKEDHRVPFGKGGGLGRYQ